VDLGMTLRFARPCSWAIFFVLASTGCGPGETNVGEDEADESGPSSDTASELVCADFTSQTECDAQDNGEIGCEWTMLARAVRTGDDCEVTQVGYCRQEEVAATITSCELLTGCFADPFVFPYYKVTPEGVLLLDTCNGTDEPGFSACPSAVAVENNPPECACACALAP
jgi:hypothetical protein